MAVQYAHKDRLFRYFFGREDNRHNLLLLYNALSGNDYQDPDDLQINTIEDVIYMGMKNDVSFIIDHEMTLLEHQSTFNPNMPLRGFLYFARLYEKYMSDTGRGLFSSFLVKIPCPRYYVLYNGTDQGLPDRLEMKLSDAFEGGEKYPEGVIHYEWTATVLNINLGSNKELLSQCRPLFEYSSFIQSVRDEMSRGLDRNEAVDRAVDICIKKGILAEFLKAHRAEVKTMLLTEYNEEEVMKGFFRDGKAEGLLEGKEEGLIEAYAKMINQGLITREDALKQGIDAELLDACLNAV